MAEYMYRELVKILNMREINQYIRASIHVEDIGDDDIDGFYFRTATGHEIVINSTLMDRFKRNPGEISYRLADVIAHEMVHQVCDIKGVEDVGKTKKYHRHAFIEQAEIYGLQVKEIEHPKYGYTYTELPIEIYEELIKNEFVYDILKKYAA